MDILQLLGVISTQYTLDREYMNIYIEYYNLSVKSSDFGKIVCNDSRCHITAMIKYQFGDKKKVAFQILIQIYHTRTSFESVTISRKSEI